MTAGDKELLDCYARRLGSMGRNRALYLKYNADFLSYAGGKLDRETILAYMQKLKRLKFSEGTVNLRFRLIRTLFNRNKMEWPFAQGEAPRISEDGIQAPALHPKTIIRMIEAVKRDGEPDERAFFAISTTYGLRRIEMEELSQRDIRIKDRTIHVATAKHGRERTHLIPEPIIPYLEAYNFDNSMSDFTLFGIWYRIEDRIGMKHIDQVGFHSIRRTVNTLLAKKLPEVTVKSFMRHKQRTSSDMTYRYSAVTFVGEEEDTVEVVGSALTVDQDVFAEGVHPFIDYWRV